MYVVEGYALLDRCGNVLLLLLGVGSYYPYYVWVLGCLCAMASLLYTFGKYIRDTCLAV